LDSEFQSIWRILREELEGDVSARDLGGPPDHMRELMKRFADGKLQPKDRDELILAMSERPDWITYLAAEIKSRRTNGDLPE
jgi:hypothetical protein